MRSFQHITPPLRLFHGPDSLGLLGRELERLKCRRAVLFCGRSLARDESLLNVVRSAMGDHCAGIFTGIRAHSPLPSVEDAAAELRRLQADSVIALGGGSAIVTARAASILLAEEGDAENLATSQNERGELKSPKLLAPKLPQLIIPTTPTTAMVKAGSAVFVPASGKRLALFDPKTRAQSIFIHPAAIMSAPRSLMISASLNSLAMAIEGLMSGSPDGLANGLLMQAIRLLSRHLPELVTQDDPTTRGHLMLAAMLCGQGTDYTGAGVTTVLGHAIGARFDAENGIVNAILLPHVLRFNAEAAQTGLQDVAAAWDVSSSQQDPLTTVTQSVEALFLAVGAPRQLREVGVPREALGEIAAHAMGDWFLRGNPRSIQETSELEQILTKAW
jgi:alcohol dehydrogenase class IV